LAGAPGSGPEIGGCVGAVCGSVATPVPTEVIDFRQEGIVRPRALCDPPAPTMPEQARIMGITGAVVMRYVVEPDGAVSRIQLRNGDAAPVLIEAVRGWLEHCRFMPGMARGKPAAIQIDQPFVFKLR
jgi:TonB family protein